MGRRSTAWRARSSGPAPPGSRTNGITIKGTWKKTALTSATRFFDAKGKPVTLTVGQTFVQVMPFGSKVTIVAGKPATLQARPPGLIQS